MQRKIILTAEQSKMKLRRMAFQIEEHNRGVGEIYLMGIRESGFLIAQLLGAMITELTTLNVQVHPVVIDKRSPLHCTLASDLDIKEIVNKFNSFLKQLGYKLPGYVDIVYYDDLK